MEEAKPLIILSAVEQRVIGVLIEKSRATPDYYPMTVNSLTAGCNQKTSRNPVVNYDEETVVLALNTLKSKGLVSTVTGAGSRSTKFKHNLAIVYPLLPSELVVLCLLFLRGPLTPGEINTLSGRMYEFDSIEEVQELLNKLSDTEVAYVKPLPRKAGQKETRFIHLFGKIQEEEETAEEPSLLAESDHEVRITRLEKELEELKDLINLIMDK